MPTETGNYSRPEGAPPRKPVTTAVRCKVCGYITDASKVGELCPACGVKATMFEPLTERFSDHRRKFLELHLHPILAHYPQAFSVTMLILAAVRFLFSNAAGRVAAHALLVLTLALPFTLVGALLTGILDGRVRFKKLTAPYLRIKKWVGAAYLLMSVLLAVLLVKGGAAPLSGALCIAASFALVVCTTVLGNIGSRIACSRLPG